MKLHFLLSALCLSVAYSFSSGIEGITLENYPRMDGSTSSEPLNRVIAKNLLKIDFDSIVYEIDDKSWSLIELTIHVNDGNGKISDIFYPRTVRPMTMKEQSYSEYIYNKEEGVVWGFNPNTWEYESDYIDLCAGCFIESIDAVYWYRGAGKKYNPEDFIGTRVKSSQTHNSIINVIDNETDITLSARKMSADEKAYAKSKGVTLIETPIGLDAFVFLKNKENPITSLTIEQIQGIYTGQITNWREVGGNNAEIIPYVRNENSGSQELMNELVLSGFPPPDYPQDLYVISGMGIVYSQLNAKPNGICYTVYYYDENKLWAPERTYPFMVFKYTDGRKQEMLKGFLNWNGEIVDTDDDYEYYVVPRISVNGIYPQYSTIKDKSYPFVAPVYAIIRSDLDKNSMAYKVYEWLQTEEGKSVIEQSGYITETAYNGYKQIINRNDIHVFPNPTSGIIHISTAGKIKVYNLQGVLLQETFGSQIDLSTYAQGLYLLQINNSLIKVAKK